MLDDNDELIPPAAFPTVAERFSLISQLDQWVVTHAIELIQQHPQLSCDLRSPGARARRRAYRGAPA
jgi:EAL domain-containing protein (putative c-di-GMP-specific phosphodiesterase class I)